MTPTCHSEAIIYKLDPHNIRRTTPTRPSAPAMTQQRVQTASEVEQLVNQEMSQGIHVASSDDFLKKFLPLPPGDNTFEIFERKYGKERLKAFGLGDGEKAENLLYPVFVDAANSILGCCGGNVHSYWVSRPNSTPKSNDKSTAQIRPDAAAVLGDQRAYFRAHQRALGEGKEAVRRNGLEHYREKIGMLGRLRIFVWWLRVTTPVEVKTTDSEENQREGSAQLCRYMRQVLRAQLDRQFVFGLLLCDHKLRVFYCDRSGLLASMDWINIRTFIQVIVGLSRLEPEKLGWDKTMLLRLQTQKKKLVFAPSTDPRVKVADYGASAYDTQWAIFVPNSDGSVDGKWYVTVRALSLSRAEVMVGRATLVWLRLTKCLQKRLVLKNAWGRTDSATEKDFYGTERVDHVGHVSCSVRIGNPTTAGKGVNSLRGDVDSGWRQWKGGFYEQGTRPRVRPRSPEDSLVHEGGGHTAPESEKPIASRILIRTVMEAYGWPIKYFKDLEEFVRVTRDTVRGHRNLYFKNGVLQRDISVGNMLACLDGDEVGETHGELIDLDHASRSPLRLKYNPREASSGFWFTVLQSNSVEFLKHNLGLNVKQLDPALFSALLRRCQGSSTKAGNTFQEMTMLYMKSPHLMHCRKGQDLDSKELLWASIQDEVRRTDFDGTMAFMSAELLGSGQFFVRNVIQRTDVPDASEVIVHTAIHDMESVFWVFLYICLTRRGPGGARREELDSGVDPKTYSEDLPAETTRAMRVRTIVEALFDSPYATALARNKRNLFQHPKDFEEDILPFIHPYFKPLETLLVRWFKLFQIAYRTYDDVGQGIIHDQVLEILDDALQTLPKQSSPEYDLMTKAELERRQRHLDQYTVFPHAPSASTCGSEPDDHQHLAPQDSPHRFPPSSSLVQVASAAQQPASSDSPTKNKPKKRLKTEPLLLGQAVREGFEVNDTIMSDRNQPIEPLSYSSRK
ncbi:hypothetical protein BXZ70DRAFT_900425 [Cristinia sonorae]|uniref:Fungal-type protein kinase domain-containing protein n=1 Tax=Cristinia sonorae TaxID=1940300 RepID=A0A8K0XKV1_9AGAR|nr:hypothetical protein BXZ70DRAFT_900425 [Cristinia sonorae]